MIQAQLDFPSRISFIAWFYCFQDVSLLRALEIGDRVNGLRDHHTARLPRYRDRHSYHASSSVEVLLHETPESQMGRFID